MKLMLHTVGFFSAAKASGERKLASHCHEANQHQYVPPYLQRINMTAAKFGGRAKMRQGVEPIIRVTHNSYHFPSMIL